MRHRLDVSGVAKSFTMHLNHGVRLPVVSDVSFKVDRGECVVLAGPSGAGKSSILKMIYGNYGVETGSIRVATSDGVVDVASAEPRTILALRRDTIGYVSQFLRAVPRVPARAIVAEPLIGRGFPRPESLAHADALLERLNIPRRLWDLPPATFSGGEQQRVNIARGFITGLPLLLLDEPTASLDKTNRAMVIEMIAEAKRRGTAFLGIFHDAEVRDLVADRIVDVSDFGQRGTA